MLAKENFNNFSYLNYNVHCTKCIVTNLMHTLYISVNIHEHQEASDFSRSA